MPGYHGALFITLLREALFAAMIIQTYPDLESLSRAAAALFAQQAEQAVKVRGRCGVALSGGQTPRRTYEILAQPPFREQVPWDRTHIFWGDERCVPPDDPGATTAWPERLCWIRCPCPGPRYIPSPAGPHRLPEPGSMKPCSGSSAPGLLPAWT